MSDILLQYDRIAPTTWVYVSSLLMIGLFFKFNRLWSVRNLDLLLLILLAPGLVLVHFGRQEQIAQSDPAAVESPLTTGAGADAVAPRGKLSSEDLEWFGFVWLLSVGGLLLLRLLSDPTMVRRPLLEPNLSPGGLIFIGCSLCVFLMANVISGTPTEDDLIGVKEAEQMISRKATQDDDGLSRHGPGYPLLHILPTISTIHLTENNHRLLEPQRQELIRRTVAKTMAIVSHLAIVLGVVVIGYRHFDNIRMGIGAATMYLMLPYTAQMTGASLHVLPAALLVWAVVFYRKPLVAGMFIGLATGVVYYPMFLLPLWVSFYWQRGRARFVGGVSLMLALAVFPLIFISGSAEDFLGHVRQMFGMWRPVMEGLDGIWAYCDPWYRLPVLAAFVVLSFSFAVWPPQKNLGTLISCSAAVMLASQFWHGHGGGVYVAWYLPLMLLTIFRPNLEDRVALTVLGESWFPRRRSDMSSVGRAA